MTTLLLILLGSFCLCLLLTPLARAGATRCRLVDQPDGRRKVHAQATPVAGGLAIYLACTASLTAALLIPSPLSAALLEQGQRLLGLLLAASVICLVGVSDDFGYLRGRHKLLGQLLAIAVLVGFGVVVRGIHLFGWEVELGLLSVPFTALWLLGAINSLNLIDGMDGLLSTVGLILSLAIAAMALLTDQWVTACVALALAGALAGFLRYNFPPATIFLGDSGSMLIGLVVGTLAIQGGMKGAATVALAAPTALLTVPFFDTVAAILRRKLTGRSIYTTDRGHLHHCLQRRGLSNRWVLVWVALFCFVTVCGALASLLLQNELVAVLAAATVVGVLIAGQLFGHAELMLLMKRLRVLGLSFVPRPAGGPGRQLEVRLQGSADWKEVWDELIGCAPRLSLVSIRFNVNAPAIQEGYHARWDTSCREAEEPTLWRAELPLAARGHTVGRLEITGRQDHQPVSVKIADVAKLMEQFENVVLTLLGPALPDLLAVTPEPAAAGKRPLAKSHNGASRVPHSAPPLTPLPEGTAG